MRTDIEHAISILRLVQQASRTGPEDLRAERISEIIAGLRYTGETRQSPFLVSLAEALEDWLITNNFH